MLPLRLGCCSAASMPWLLVTVRFLESGRGKSAFADEKSHKIVAVLVGFEAAGWQLRSEAEAVAEAEAAE